MALPSGQAYGSGSKIWNSLLLLVAPWIWLSRFGCWNFKIHPHWKLYNMAMEHHILQMVGGFLVIFVFVGFSFDLLRLSFLRLFGSNPSSPERKSADQIALAKVQDDITCHLSRRLREPFEWILNILTLILQDTPGGNTVTCTSVIETLKWHIFNWKTYIFELELQDTTLTIKQIIRQLFNDLIVIIGQNHPGSFSDPILPSGCSCVKPMFAIPSNVASDVVFTSKKSVLFLLLHICSANHSHRRVGCMFSIVSMFFTFRVFSHRPTSWSSSCYDDFSERSPAAAGWMALEWWRCIGSPAMHGNTVMGWTLT